MLLETVPVFFRVIAFPLHNRAFDAALHHISEVFGLLLKPCNSRELLCRERGDITSLDALITKQHGGNYLQKIARHDGSHTAYAPGLRGWVPLTFRLSLTFKDSPHK